jgi:HlyD family secretion protein/macrolide-specific efflux system membrane fusion protein
VQHDKDDDYVRVLSGSGAADRRTVKIGTETADTTEIVSGVNVGETVVLE